MWQMITGFGPDLPPQAGRASFTKPNGVEISFWSYGAILMEQIPQTLNHDADLRATVAWCMGEFRPLLREMGVAPAGLWRLSVLRLVLICDLTFTAVSPDDRPRSE